MSSAPPEPLQVLVIDDERPALDELAFLLARDPRVGEVLTCDSATEALRTLHEIEVHAVFLDIQMPGLTGLDLAQVLARFRTPPPVVFVTAHDEHAVEAFELRAVDYVLKPVREERLAEAVRRVVEDAGRSGPSSDRQIPVERGGVTRFVNRSATTHACTPATTPTCCAPRSPGWPTTGRARASCGSTVPCWSPSPTSRSSVPTAGTARWSSRATSWR